MATQVYLTILSTPLGSLYGGQASALTGIAYDATGTPIPLYNASGAATGTTVIAHQEIGGATGDYAAWVYVATGVSGVVRYTWTGTPAISNLGTDVLEQAPATPALVVTGTVAAPSAGGGATNPPLLLTDPRWDIIYARNTQKSFITIFSADMRARGLQWLVKTNKTDVSPLISYSVAGGGITLNSTTVTINSVVYAAGLVGTTTILPGDMSSTTTFPEYPTRLWHAFHCTGPVEEPVFGYFALQTEP